MTAQHFLSITPCHNTSDLCLKLCRQQKGLADVLLCDTSYIIFAAQSYAIDMQCKGYHHVVSLSQN